MIIFGIEITAAAATSIVSALVLILTTLITTYLVPMLRSIKEKGNLDFLRALVDVAAQAAEQIYGAKTGITKKQYVLDFLAKRGVKIDPALLDTLLEASVLEITNTITQATSDQVSNVNKAVQSKVPLRTTIDIKTDTNPEKGLPNTKSGSGIQLS